ncbi:MAG: hypothetical protein KGM49_03835 [Sphingomonadales bacterium]|nr:hypothetical protein [Sphingomonadales bacterium]
MPIDVTAWSALVLGLSALFAGVGALRKPGIWRTMIEEVERSPAMQFVCGMLELVVGTVIYLANPWAPADVLACVLKGMGGLMMIEALVILGFCDIYTQFWLRSLGNMQRGWALSTIALGLALVVVGAGRFN